MKIEYDERADLLYLRLDPRTQDVVNRRVSDDVILDMGEGQMIVGRRPQDSLEEGSSSRPVLPVLSLGTCVVS